MVHVVHSCLGLAVHIIEDTGRLPDEAKYLGIGVHMSYIGNASILTALLDNIVFCSQINIITIHYKSASMR